MPGAVGSSNIRFDVMVASATVPPSQLKVRYVIPYSRSFLEICEEPQAGASLRIPIPLIPSTYFFYSSAAADCRLLTGPTGLVLFL